MNAAKSRENERVFVDHVLQLLQGLGDVRAKSMFGGHGVYCNQVMMGLIAQSVLYFKVDEISRPLFEAEGCGPFLYQRKGQSEPIAMSYYEAPVDAMERAEALCKWGQRACDAARRSAAGKSPKKKKPKKKSPKKKPTKKTTPKKKKRRTE